MINIFQNNRHLRFYFIVITAFILVALPVLFLENELFAGVCGIAGITIFVFASKAAASKKQFILFLLSLWLSYCIRFSLLFGDQFKISILIYLLMIPTTLLAGIVFLLDNYLLKKRKYIFHLFLFPLFYTVLCFLLADLNFGNLVNLLTYFMLIPIISFNISWLGEYGMTFICCVIITLITDSFIFNDHKKKFLCYVSIILIISVLFIFGLDYKSDEKYPDYSLNVAVAVREEMDFLGNSDVEYSFDQKFNLFKNCVINASENGADFLILSEEFFEVDSDCKDKILKQYCDVLMDYKMPALLSFEICNEEGEKNVNEAVFVDSDGNILYEYIKNNLVPFIESSSYESGTETPGYIKYEFNYHCVNISYVICFDINDSNYLHKISDDTELLLVPSWDWDCCNIEQKRIRIRSAELNTTMLHHCYDGFTFVSGPYGLCGDYIDFRDTYEEVKMITVPIWEKD